MTERRPPKHAGGGLRPSIEVFEAPNLKGHVCAESNLRLALSQPEQEIPDALIGEQFRHWVERIAERINLGAQLPEILR